MRNLLTAIFFLLTLGSTSAQDSSTVKTNFHEIGIDAGPLVRQLLSFGSGSYPRDPYFILYRYHFGGWALRAGIGASLYGAEISTNDTIRSNGDFTYLEYHLGIEKSVSLPGKWSSYYGVDVLGTYYEDFAVNKGSSQQTVTYFTKNNGYGAKLLLGFRYQFNNRLAITTEYNYRLLYIHGYDKRTQTLNPQYGRTIKSRRVEAELNPYLTLTFNYIL